MKKFMKGCAYTALVLIAVGLVLALWATAVEGTHAISKFVRDVTGGYVSLDVSEMSEEIASDIEENIVGDMGDGFDIDADSLFSEEYDMITGDFPKTRIASGEVRNLDIEVGGSVLTLKESEDDSFYLEGTKTGKMQGYEESGTLHIKALRGAKKWNDAEACKIILYVPKDYSFAEVEVELGAGQISLGSITAESIDVETGAGQLLADSIKAEEVNISVGAGEMIVETMEAAVLDAEIGMGRFKAYGDITREGSIECAMGSAELVLMGAQEDYNYTMDCVAGNIDIGTESYSEALQEKTVDNHGAKWLELSCAMGNIEIDFD